MILSEFFKSFFTIKKFPSQYEIVISRKCQRVALGLLIIGIVILAVAFVATVYKILFFSGLKVEVGEFSFWGLLLSLAIAILAIIKMFVKLMNSYINYLIGFQEKRLKVVFGSIASYFFTVYLTIFGINQASILGLYNDKAHQSFCMVYVHDGEKNDECLRYENELYKDTSLLGRVLLRATISEYF